MLVRTTSLLDKLYWKATNTVLQKKVVKGWLKVAHSVLDGMNKSVPILPMHRRTKGWFSGPAGLKSGSLGCPYLEASVSASCRHFWLALEPLSVDFRRQSQCSDCFHQLHRHVFGLDLTLIRFWANVIMPAGWNLTSLMNMMSLATVSDTCERCTVPICHHCRHDLLVATTADMIYWLSSLQTWFTGCVLWMKVSGKFRHTQSCLVRYEGRLAHVRHCWGYPEVGKVGDCGQGLVQMSLRKLTYYCWTT